MIKKLTIKLLIYFIVVSLITPLMLITPYAASVDIGEEFRLYNKKNISINIGNQTFRKRNIVKLVDEEPVLGDPVIYESFYENGGYYNYYLREYNPYIPVRSDYTLLGKVIKVKDYPEGGVYYKTVNFGTSRNNVFRTIDDIGDIKKNDLVTVKTDEYEIGDIILETYTDYWENFVYRFYDGVEYKGRTILGKMEIYDLGGSGSSAYVYPSINKSKRLVRGNAIPESISSEFEWDIDAKNSNKVTLLKDGRILFMNREKVWIYDPVTDTWQQRADHPIMADPSVELMITPSLTTLEDGTVAVLGGAYRFANSYDYRDIESLYIYHPTTDIWKKVGRDLTPGATNSFLALLDDGLIFSAGGEFVSYDKYYNYNEGVFTIDRLDGRATRIYDISSYYLHGYTNMTGGKTSNGNIVFMGGWQSPSANTRLFIYDTETESFSSQFLSDYVYTEMGGFYHLTAVQIDDDLFMFRDRLRLFAYDAKEDKIGLYPFNNIPYMNRIRPHDYMMKGIYAGNGKTIFVGSDNYFYTLGDNQAPSITVNSPQEGAEFGKGQTVSLKWSASDPEGDRITHNIQLGTALGEDDIYSGLPNTRRTQSQGEHRFNTSSINLEYNPSTGRHEKRIYATIKVSDGVVTTVREVSFLVVNYPPNITVSTPAITHVFNYTDPITISGKAWDSMRDPITVSATIDGKTKTQLINPSPSSSPSSNNFNLTWSSSTALAEGEYSNIKFKVVDSSGAKKVVTWGGRIVVKDVLKKIDTDIDKITLGKDDDVRLTVANTEASVANTTRNTNLLSNIGKGLKNRDSAMYYSGKSGTTERYITSKLDSSLDFRYGDYKDGNNSEIVDFVMDLLDEKQESIIYEVGKSLDTKILFKDTENDYESISEKDKIKKESELSPALKKPKAGTLKIKYVHDPSIFDNPVGRHSKGRGSWRTIENEDDSYVLKKAESNMRGEWTLTVKASDTTGKSGFDKYSDEVTIPFIIHQAPVAKINMFDRSSEWWLTGEESFDLDYQYSKANNGIVKYEWSYETESGQKVTISDNSMRVAIPKVYNGSNVTSFSLTVTDYHGATHTTKETSPVTPKILSKLSPELSKFNILTSGIPASEELKVTDIQTIPEAFNKIEFGIYQGGNLKKSYTAHKNSANVVSTDILVADWQDKRNMVIPSTLPDGNYTMKLKSNYGTSPVENSHSFKVFTPIDLVPKIPSKIQADTNIIIEATTSKYANAVTVDVFSDGNKKSMVLDRVENGFKYWKLNYHVPINKPEGNHNATFRATTPNGNTEVKVLPFFLRVLDLKDLRITNMINHIEYEGKYPIYYNGPEVPVNYKAGYYVTFEITAVGDPDQVQLKISYPGYAKTLNMTKESQSGSESTWVGEWYSDPKLKKGTIINTVATADKGTVHLNFNTKYGWNGDYLKVIGSIEGDWRIDQEL